MNREEEKQIDPRELRKSMPTWFKRSPVGEAVLADAMVRGQPQVVREIIEKAELLKLEASITDLPKRLTKLEAELPTLSR